VPLRPPYHPRRLSPRECLRLMGFGDGWFVLADEPPAGGGSQQEGGRTDGAAAAGLRRQVRIVICALAVQAPCTQCPTAHH
jgi:site-specific DNA-cytosine methylase